MEIFLNALRALWATIRASSASKAASELPQGAAQVKAVEADLAEITGELARTELAPTPPLPVPPVPPVTPPPVPSPK